MIKFQRILADILEGYFPYQLKEKFPNGTLLKIVDRLGENYEPSKEKEPSIKNFENIDDMNLKAQTREEYLSKLPSAVIKDGIVIPIRSEISKKLGGPSPPIQSSPTDTVFIHN